MDAGGTDPKMVNSGMTKLENVRFKRAGAISKRNGYSTFAATVSDLFMGVHKDRALAFGDTIMVHDGATQAAGNFSAIGTDESRCGIIDVARKSLYQVAVGGAAAAEEQRVYYPDLCVKGSIIAIVWTQKRSGSANYDVNLAVVHRYKRTLISTETLLANQSYQGNARVIDSGTGGIHVFYFTSGQVMQVRELNSTTGAWVAAATALSASSSIGHTVGGDTRVFDAAAIGGGSNTGITVYHEDTTDDLAITFTDTNGGIADDGSVRIVGNGAWVFTVAPSWTDGEGIIAYCDDGAATPQVRAVVYDAEQNDTVADFLIAAPGNSTVLRIGAVSDGTSTGRVYWDDRDISGAAPEGDPIIWRSEIDASGLVAGTVTEMLRALQLWSKPVFSSGSQYYIGGYWQDPVDPQDLISSPSLFVIRDDGHNSGGNLDKHPIVGKALLGAAGMPKEYNDPVDGSGPSQKLLCTPISTGTDEWSIAAPELLKADESDPESGVAEIVLNAAPASVRPFEVGNSLVIPNSCPYEWDGARIFEQGFLHFPYYDSSLGTARTNVTAAAGSSGLSAGTYGVVFVYESYDAQGQRHQSAPSNPISITVSAADDLTYACNTLRLTRRPDVKIVAYRTLVNGSVYYRSKIVANDPASDRVTWTDTDSDATLSTHEKLYANAELPNLHPEPHRVATMHQGRHVYVPRHNEAFELRYGKIHIDGRGLHHHGLFRLWMSSEGGDITALQEMDDKLFIFKADRIYSTDGIGFSSDGSGVNYNEPRLVTSGAGCTNQKSVVQTPMGIMFVARDGIKLLSRDLQLQHVGRRVKYYTDTDSITAAVLKTATNEVIFFTDDNALVYNYLFDQWSTWTNHAAKDAVTAFAGVLYWRRDGATSVSVEDTSGFSDVAAAVVATLETGWVHFGRPVGRSRVYRVLGVGQSIGGGAARQLRAAWQFNLDPTWSTAKTLDLDSLGSEHAYTDHLGAGLASTYENKALIFRARSPRQKVSAARVRIDDSGSDAGETFDISALAFEVGALPAAHKVGTSRTT
jgi:hypothetical protein